MNTIEGLNFTKLKIQNFGQCCFDLHVYRLSCQVLDCLHCREEVLSDVCL